MLEKALLRVGQADNDPFVQAARIDALLVRDKLQEALECANAQGDSLAHAWSLYRISHTARLSFQPKMVQQVRQLAFALPSPPANDDEKLARLLLWDAINVDVFCEEDAMEVPRQWAAILKHACHPNIVQQDLQLGLRTDSSAKRSSVAALVLRQFSCSRRAEAVVRHGALLWVVKRQVPTVPTGIHPVELHATSAICAA